MFFTLLSLLPEPVLVILSATLLLLTAGGLIVIISVLLSEVACERVIRLINAVAKLTNKSIQQIEHRQRRGK